MAGDDPGPYSKDVLPSPRVCTEEMFHVVVERRVQGKVTDHRSDAEHIRTDHKADYNSHEPAKSGFPGKAGTET